MAIPADAPHPEEAHAFIAYLMRPAVVGPLTNEIGYANAVPASTAFVSPDILNDPVIYPPEAVKRKLVSLPPPPLRYDRLRTRTWTRVRSGR